jgi:hypothetical protein
MQKYTHLIFMTTQVSYFRVTFKILVAIFVRSVFNLTTICYLDFDCILTSLNLEKLEKNKYRLPKEELNRIKSILDRALAVEKGTTYSIIMSLYNLNIWCLGSARPEVNESHPDGLDLSLFKDQAQLKKKRQKEKVEKQKSTSPKRKSKPSASSSSESSEDESGSSSEESSSEEEEDEKPTKQTKGVINALVVCYKY